MDFALNDQQELLKKEARRFFETECPKKLVREVQKSAPGYSREIWQKMAELGWIGLMVPEEYNGSGGTLFDLGLLFEEIGRAVCPGPLFSTILFGVVPLLLAGSEEQKRRILPAVANGEVVLTMALSEPEADYEPRFMTTQARAGNGGYALFGTKLFVPYAHVADMVLTVAATGPVDADGKGMTVFLVPGVAEGLSLTALDSIGRDKLHEVTFDAVRTGAGDALGGIGAGWPVVEATLDKATAVQCMETVGVMQQELSMTAEYTQNRVQFGRPIGSFQAVQHRLADMMMDVEGARWLSYRAVSQLGEGLPARREVAVAKAWVSNACQRVAYSAQHLHGGMGMDMEHDLHFYFEWAKARQLTLGPAAWHLDRVGPAGRGGPPGAGQWIS